jgi:hypothetical protein
MIGRSWRGRVLANNPQLLAEFGYPFQERASIIEYHGGLDREDAEMLAWTEMEALLRTLDRRRASARAATEHWHPHKPDLDALAE